MGAISNLHKGIPWASGSSQSFPLSELQVYQLGETLLDGFQGIFELFDLKAFWGRLCGWLSSFSSCSVVLPCLGCLWSQQGTPCARKRGLVRGELQGCSEDRVVLRQILVMRGQRGVRPKAGVTKSGLILLNIGTVAETRALLAPCTRGTCKYQVLTISSLWPDYLASDNRHLDVSVTWYLIWAKGQW